MTRINASDVSDRKVFIEKKGFFQWRILREVNELISCFVGLGQYTNVRDLDRREPLKGVNQTADKRILSPGVGKAGRSVTSLPYLDNVLYLRCYCKYSVTSYLYI